MIDDVLCETFRHLDDDDLFTVADVCLPFRRNAQTEFSLRYKHKYIGFRIRKKNFGPLLFVLRRFGPLIRFLRIILHDSTPNCSQKLLEIIIRYCGETLDGLSLRNIIFTTSLTPQLRSLFSRLQELNAYKCRWESYIVGTKMFSSCQQMLALAIQEIRDFEGCRIFPIRANIPKLKSVCIIECDCRLGLEPIKKFFEVNPQLLEIEIKITGIEQNHMIRYIVQCCPQIEKLRFGSGNFPENFIENAKLLKRATALKLLSICCAGKPFSPVLNELVAAHISLECLQLHTFTSDQALVDGILAMKELKTLELSEGKNMKMDDILIIIRKLNELSNLKLTIPSLSPGDLMDIVRIAPKLRFLGYEHGYGHERHVDGNQFHLKFDEPTFKKLLAVVESRKKQYSFVLKMPFGAIDVPRNTLNSTKHILEIVYY